MLESEERSDQLVSEDDRTEDHRAHAVVIGSGFGGLAAAVRLGAKGYRVTVLEKLDAPGGRAYVYRQDGFTFDGGPTIITAPYLFEELWSLCGKRFEDHIDLRSIDPFYKIRFDNGQVFTYSSDPEAMREEVRRFCANDLDGYDRFMRRSGEIYKVAFEELAAVSFHSFPFMLSTFPDLLRLGGHRTVYSTVCKYFKDPLLRVTFSFHPLLIGGNPLTTTAFYCLIAHLERKFGVHYAMGGTGALVQGLIDLIRGQGGDVRYNTEVETILVDNGTAKSVRLKSGEMIDAKIVVSNADSALTSSKLLAGSGAEWPDNKVKRLDFSMSLFVWYFGTNKQFDDVYHHTMVLGPRYEGLLEDIFSNKRLSDDFSLYLHRPTANDPSLAPAGCDAFYVLAPVPHLASGVDWKIKAEPYRQAVERRLEETLMPRLKDAIVSSHMLTPQDFQDRLSSVHGAAFSIEPKLFQSAWFRPHNRHSKVKNLFLVGAGTHPGAGVPGVLSSAKVMDDLCPAPAEFD
ncbi:MAG: phytoene desaturase [Pseudomonadota bacterium]